ncbi:hypothetical protein AJ85_16955 [Alkalihalobacillus alcalophilus ATCC 27647 = CGMCC 1.3604]|uniref:Uncharacterized protein n=1 Tax=Alkalihalobacillus alcalophilus ATCC 27647 = CGMCC 1.3604 TaxID=1218173 RepID=A0A094WG97_ALKAL|nr:tetratricopeptide repeat protein [Alkalihalobacillus alcalophilus]KGA96754.1 hypothetical protein BALCAV_0214455 [Alkalihalobacillus alcalophilus ATCC 27647 = CGMCC 1.3604]MED1563828.1 tetratricopeptide repeat protein [Alkalihalobacillus alcalophilus]THG92133.1 hypothetical protein AJ85_16955 [Alkalihalobacillus alcalophilus ATCC 27647 = CGMCC 1.3604]
MNQINPQLICALTGKKKEEVPELPTLSALPSKYVQLVSKNIKKIVPPFESNLQFLICKNCGKKAQYNLGHLTINLRNYNKNKQAEVDEYVQPTGYFRCKQCNSAGKWDITNEYRIMLISALMMLSSNSEDSRFSLGENRLFDGSSHTYATDSEEHLLNTLMESKEDSFVWNRLGNLYYKGGRADLAACAYEHSIALNPQQTESLFSLGMILSAIGEAQEAANYLHKMLISSSSYRQMKASDLRDLLSNGLNELFHLNTLSNGVISVPPPIELYKEFHINIPSSEEGSIEVLEGEIVTDDLTSFYPIAELFMGERSKELPGNKKYFMKKKKKKRKRKK